MYYVWYIIDYLKDNHKEDIVNYFKDNYKEDTYTNILEINCPYPT